MENFPDSTKGGGETAKRKQNTQNTMQGLAQRVRNHSVNGLTNAMKRQPLRLEKKDQKP